MTDRFKAKHCPPFPFSLFPLAFPKALCYGLASFLFHESGQKAHFFFGMDYEIILQKVENLVSPILANLGLELIERALVMDQGRFVLRLYIDREGSSITIDDCETASRAIEGVLDVENLIPHRYCLEVSSPGLNRPLRRPKDFEKFAGSRVEMKTKEPLKGRQNFVGTLKGVQDGEVVLEVETQEWRIPLSLIKKARIKPW